MENREREKNESVQIAERLLEGTLEASAILSAEGRVVVENSEWRRLTSDYCYELSFLNKDVVDFPCLFNLLNGSSSARLSSFINGEIDNVSFDLSDSVQTRRSHLSLNIFCLGISKKLSYLMTMTDNSESTSIRNALRDIVYLDSLSGFGNECSLHTHLASKMHTSRVTGSSFSIVCVTLSDSKEIVAMFGKRTADILVQRISRRLAKAVPKAEFFRVMDDVFVIVMDLSDRKEVSSTVISLLSALESPVVVTDTEISPSVAIGICQFPVDGESSDALFSNCLSSVFAAKREGLKWRFYS
ncbi:MULTISPECIES: diguanylate cyclase domain-containing protein [unclassified Mesotoga]|uniref:GGDEF domain-containing protein n=1 Tax=unclassified Mesotoga TaxID=1184398 RepID=UPI000DA6B6AC|nr:MULTISPECIES: diguanylate cyclase [unclassified Mesotoga]PZC51451.1 hypothetical protein LH53_11080 [Mesotoga sp. TolDC]